MTAEILTSLLLVAGSLSFYILNIFAFPHLFPEASLTKLFLLFLSVNVTLWTVWKAFIYPTWFSPMRALPKPNGALPLIGFAHRLFGRPLGDTFLSMMRNVPNEGLIRIPSVLGIQRLLLTSPASLAEVLVHKSYDYQKPAELRNFLRLILGDGMIVVEGDVHKFQRKHVAPAFSFRHIKELYPKFWAKAVLLSQGIAAQIKDNPEYAAGGDKGITSVVEVNHWANKVTMDIIGVAGAGREFNSLINNDDELIKNYEELLEPTTEKAVFFGANLVLGQRLTGMLPWKLNDRLKATTARLRNICLDLVKDKKALMKSGGEEQIDVLSLLIKSNDFADDMLVDQLLTFLAAGHETTSSAFTWAAYLLSANPKIQSRLREEVRAHLPSPSTSSDPSINIGGIIESLPYLNAVCAETLRLYPTVPVTIRVATVDTTIGTQVVPSGTRLYIAPWAINRLPDLWGPDAGEFVPDRWIDSVDSEDGKVSQRFNNHGGVSSNYSNLTFLHGPRSCIGERFAKSELKALVAVFCGTFEINRVAGSTEVPVPFGAITTKPKDGMNLSLRVLEGW